MALSFALLPLVAQASIDPGLLNDVLQQFETATTGWVTSLHPIALATFGALAAVELSWTGIRTVLQSDGGLDRFFEVLLRKSIFLAFVYWLIDVGPAVLPLIIGGFQRAGAIASGIDRLHPSSFLSTGVAIAGNYLAQLNALGLLVDPLGVFMAGSGALLTVLAFAMMSGIMLLTLVEALVAIGAMPFLLAMAGSRWTAAIAEGSITYVVRTGIKLFLIYLLGAIIDALTVEWANRINGALPVGPMTYLSFLGSAWTLVLLLWSLPRQVANLVPSLHLRLSPAVGDN